MLLEISATVTSEISKIVVEIAQNPKTRDNTDAALDRGRAASVLMPAKPVVAV